jgi:hypothetical protein
MDSPARVVLVHSCAFCGQVVAEGPDRAILHVSMVPERGGARFYCHVACLEQRLHAGAREGFRRG